MLLVFLLERLQVFRVAHRSEQTTMPFYVPSSLPVSSMRPCRPRWHHGRLWEPILVAWWHPGHVIPQWVLRDQQHNLSLYINL